MNCLSILAKRNSCSPDSVVTRKKLSLYHITASHDNTDCVQITWFDHQFEIDEGETIRRLEHVRQDWKKQK